MERVILFQPYEFLSYSICKLLLDEGIQVKTITSSINDDLLFTSEKRMEIGRNANFYENDFDNDWTELTEDDQERIPVIIPIYDLFMKKEEMKLVANKDFLPFLDKLKPEFFPITLLLPEQYAYTPNRDGESIEQLTEFLFEKNYSCQEIYLPTLYGPWQPEEYYFQQLLFPSNDKCSLPKLNKREAVTDAIFIDDGAQEVFQLLGKGAGKYLLRSGMNQGWFQCVEEILADKRIHEREDINEIKSQWENQLEILKQKEANTGKLLQANKCLNTIFVKKSIESIKGIALQQKQFEFLVNCK
ncbi:hypothetical protein [Bacillus sp. B15-48]|uniref:hypothetical protein n=1 Tax=Bacillus sp. B15-48 TaxID=1548601 RepID=UPI0019401754|nr:hypothetical protein [Bacillus sp. B15-48]MBM4764239.1 hypothetical protein [Bacillus sp. B15-48]